MKKTCKLCWGLSAVLLIAVLAMGYLFVVRGNVIESSDGRTAIILEPGERDFVLAEMRAFLEGVKGITGALANENIAGAITQAKKIGMADTGSVPLTLISKLPLEFKTLGFATHKAFDTLAENAQKGGTSLTVLKELAGIMENCTTCHSEYRIDANNRNNE